MKNALKNGTLDLPKKYEAARERFEQIIANADRKPPVRDASRDVVVRLNKQVNALPGVPGAVEQDQAENRPTG